jgi:hypothetical protein
MLANLWGAQKIGRYFLLRHHMANGLNSFVDILTPYSMYILKIENGKLELRKNTGSYVRTLVSKGVVSAQLNAGQTLVLVTLIDGKVELRKDTGSYVRTLASKDAVDASWMGTEVAIRLRNGKTEVRSQTGSYIRTL